MFGLKPAPVILATLAFNGFGALWYGLIFSDAWMAAEGYVEADFQASSPAWMALSVLISLLSVIVIGKVLQWASVASIGDALQCTLILWVGFGVTMALYTLSYSPQHSVGLFLIDAGHLLIGWLVAAVILAAMK